MSKYFESKNSTTDSVDVEKEVEKKESVKFYNDLSVDDIIELQDISQTYGENTIISDFNFLAERSTTKGVFKVILGPSGCGKSTILRYISGLQTPTSGKVLINGVERKDGEAVGMVFQKYSSFPWRTVLSNVSYGLEIKNYWYHRFFNLFRPKDKKVEILSKSEIKQRAIEMIKSVGLIGQEHKYAQYPNLSGGQLQRVAIARSLLSTPEILLMDEPFGALDVPTRLQMQDMLLDISKNIKPTIILITHDITEAVYLADDIYIMSKAPSNIVHHINVSSILPDERKGTKRTKDFTDLVQKVEDTMMSLNINFKN